MAMRKRTGPSSGIRRISERRKVCESLHRPHDVSVSERAARFPVRLRSAFYADHARRRPAVLGVGQFYRTSHRRASLGELHIMTACEQGYVRLYFYTPEELRP